MALAPSIEGVHGVGLGTDLLRTAGLIEYSTRAAKALESGSSTHARCALDAVMDDTTARQPGRLARTPDNGRGTLCRSGRILAKLSGQG